MLIIKAIVHISFLLLLFILEKTILELELLWVSDDHGLGDGACVFTLPQSSGLHHANWDLLLLVGLRLSWRLLLGLPLLPNLLLLPQLDIGERAGGMVFAIGLASNLGDVLNRAIVEGAEALVRFGQVVLAGLAGLLDLHLDCKPLANVGGLAVLAFLHLYAFVPGGVGHGLLPRDDLLDLVAGELGGRHRGVRPRLRGDVVGREAGRTLLLLVERQDIRRAALVCQVRRRVHWLLPVPPGLHACRIRSAIGDAVLNHELAALLVGIPEVLVLFPGNRVLNELCVLRLRLGCWFLGGLVVSYGTGVHSFSGRLILFQFVDWQKLRHRALHLVWRHEAPIGEYVGAGVFRRGKWFGIGWLRTIFHSLHLVGRVLRRDREVVTG